MKFPPFSIKKVTRLFVNRLRRFTCIPRRFTSVYWDDRHVINCTVWWQWFRRCFFIHNRTIVRPIFSSWEQIITRMENGDLDALLIYEFVQRFSTRTEMDPRYAYTAAVQKYIPSEEISAYQQWKKLAQSHEP